jgi:hypothetical protein
VTLSVLRRPTTGRDCLGYGFPFRRNDRWPDDHPPPFWKKGPIPGGWRLTTLGVSGLRRSFRIEVIALLLAIFSRIFLRGCSAHLIHILSLKCLTHASMRGRAFELVPAPFGEADDRLLTGSRPQHHHLHVMRGRIQ